PRAHLFERGACARVPRFDPVALHSARLFRPLGQRGDSGRPGRESRLVAFADAGDRLAACAAPRPPREPACGEPGCVPLSPVPSGGGRGEMTIASVEAIPVLYPVSGFFKFFESAAGRSPGRPAVLVRVTAADGSQGWGECVPSPRWSYETLETVLT